MKVGRWKKDLSFLKRQCFHQVSHDGFGERVFSTHFRLVVFFSLSLNWRNNRNHVLTTRHSILNQLKEFKPCELFFFSFLLCLLTWLALDFFPSNIFRENFLLNWQAAVYKKCHPGRGEREDNKNKKRKKEGRRRSEFAVECNFHAQRDRRKKEEEKSSPLFFLSLNVFVWCFIFDHFSRFSSVAPIITSGGIFPHHLLEGEKEATGVKSCSSFLFYKFFFSFLQKKKREKREYR